MMLPYALRLLCLCFASFFVVNGVLALLAQIGGRASSGITATMKPKAAAQLLFTLRMLPVAVAVIVVLGLCIPSYFWLEPEGATERVGLACIALGILGGASWMASLVRAGRAVVTSMRFNRLCGKRTEWIAIAEKKLRAVVVEDEAPLLAMAGLIHPKLLVSRGVLRALSAEELEAAVLHEMAHRRSRDNFKRLLVLLAPGILPLARGFPTFEQSWARFAEWAADDEAAAGDARRALSLAGALVRVARMGAGPRLSFLHTSLVAGDRDFSARVERLLRAEPQPARRDWPMRSLVSGGSVFLAMCLAGLVVWPGALLAVHRVLEVFLR
jgi:Zn-dependent protease with chaperone function